MDFRISNPPLMKVKELKKASVPRGFYSYGAKCKQYWRITENKEEVKYLNVIKSYNASMGGINNSDMLCISTTPS